MNVLVADKVALLGTLAPCQLLELPEFSTEEVTTGSKTIKLTVWHDTLPGGEHRFVVQAVDDSGALGLAIADGFALQKNDSKRALTREELTEFT